MPPSTPILPPTPTEYRTALVYRILLAVAVPLMVVGISFAAVGIWQKSHGAQGATLAFVAGLLAAIIFLVYSLAAAFKSAFIIAPDRIIEQNVWPFATKELLLREIAGFRTNDKFTSIHSTQPDLPTLKIAKSIESYDDLQLWLAGHYPDLDQVEAEDTRAILLADEQLGATPEARAARLALAKRVGTALNILGGVAAAWLFLNPEPYTYAIAANVALPLLAAGALLVFPGLMRLDTGKNTPHASVASALLLPSFALLVRSLAHAEPLQYATVWPVAGLAAAAFAVLLVISNRHWLLEFGTLRRNSGPEWGLLLLCAAAYGYGATLTSNVAFDASKLTTYQAQVLAKHKTTGKTTSYYLRLSPWGPRKASEDVAVNVSYYGIPVVGDTVPIATRPGWLGIPWFQVGQ
ncbi:MAG: hypothetical protein EOO62_20945 [Hymenobacter sp.]|nr:MAG: hypothetical protein EOO62_20945 [Hymenobacter sp.]